MEGRSVTRIQAGTLTGRVQVNGWPSEASLTSGGKLRWRGEKGERCLSLESEALGFAEEKGRRLIRIITFVAKNVGKSRRVRKDIILEMESLELVLLWAQKLRDCFNSFGRPKRLFIILNPFGGKKSALRIFDNEIKPLLVAAEVPYKLTVTNHQLHAQEIAYKLELQKYDGIVCVSGDGVLVEIVNGLLQRDDWDTAIKMPLGIIPAGTGNGMAKSLLHSSGEMYSISNATFSVIRGHKRPLDVTTVKQGNINFFSVLMLTWGLIADVDIESERFRWMGRTRLDIYFVPAPGYEMYGGQLRHYDDWREDALIPEQDDGCGYQGPSTSYESLEWRSMDGPFILVWLNNVPWAGEDIMPAPEAKFSDGYLDVIIMKDCPKSALLSLMLKMADGRHITSPYLIYMKVKAFRLEPGQRVGNASKGGIIDSDGEVIARGIGTYDMDQQVSDLMAYGPAIDMFVDKGLATIFSPR